MGLWGHTGGTNHSTEKHTAISDLLTINHPFQNSCSRHVGRKRKGFGTRCPTAGTSYERSTGSRSRDHRSDKKIPFETRPLYHQCDTTIRGHVFCSFLALILRKELDRRLNHAGFVVEWVDIRQDLKALQEVQIEEGNQRFSIRTECIGNCGKIFQAVGVALPPTIRTLS